MNSDIYLTHTKQSNKLHLNQHLQLQQTIHSINSTKEFNRWQKEFPIADFNLKKPWCTQQDNLHNQAEHTILASSLSYLIVRSSVILQSVTLSAKSASTLPSLLKTLARYLKMSITSILTPTNKYFIHEWLQKNSYALHKT